MPEILRSGYGVEGTAYTGNLEASKGAPKIMRKVVGLRQRLRCVDKGAPLTDSDSTASE